MTDTAAVTDATALVRAPGAPGRISTPVGTLEGSAILKVAAEIRQRVAAGEKICNLTVGDFDPRQFRIPRFLEEGISAALQHGETNYPPSPGMPSLRDAILSYYERSLGLRYPVESVLVTAGSRPGVYGTYCTLVDPGDRVVYPAPSWNNNYYCHMVGAVADAVTTTPEDGFMPTPDTLAPHLRGARLLALNSPLNPCGTAFSAESLGAICDLVLEENARRGAADRPLFVMFDQVYWTITFDGVRHVHPVGLRPAMAPYTVYVDGASKSLAATGIRVGWIVAPPDLAGPMSALVGHMGAWAPKAEQGAVAAFLEDASAFAEFRAGMVARVRERLDALFLGLSAMRDEGLPVEVIAPEGAIYLSARFALGGRVAPDGTSLDSDESVRAYLLRAAGMAMVPLRAFGVERECGWHRLSAGAVSVAEIERVLPRLRAALIAARAG